ncbi:MAG: cupin domain-containing protein [Bacillota bacterium]|jgi:cupin 2 domain-containing protein
MNIFNVSFPSEDKEITDTLLSGRNVLIERIVSTGQASPEGFWYDQEEDEWVAVLQGRAKLAWDDGRELVMEPGDWVLLPAHERHRVEWTSKNPPCIWLAVKGRLC